VEISRKGDINSPSVVNLMNYNDMHETEIYSNVNGRSVGLITTYVFDHIIDYQASMSFTA